MAEPPQELYFSEKEDLPCVWEKYDELKTDATESLNDSNESKEAKGKDATPIEEHQQENKRDGKQYPLHKRSPDATLSGASKSREKRHKLDGEANPYRQGGGKSYQQQNRPRHAPSSGTSQSCQKTLKSDGEEATAVHNSILSRSLPTLGESTKLFFETLAKRFPRHFSIDELVAVRSKGQVRIANPYVLVAGTSTNCSYSDLFGTLTKEESYVRGPVVEAVDELVPFMKGPDKEAVKQARIYLREACAIRYYNLNDRSPSFLSHRYMADVMQGTLRYFDQLVLWLEKKNAGPWHHGNAYEDMLQASSGDSD